MKDLGPAGGRRNRRRGRPNSSSNNGQKKARFRNRQGGNRSAQPWTNGGLPEQDGGDKHSVLGGWRRAGENQAAAGEGAQDGGPPDGFQLFCAYHLGITRDEGYSRPSLTEVARRFGMNPEEVKALLVQHRLDHETMKGTAFDLQGAQLDIRVAPAGISRVAIARDHYDEYVAQFDN